MYLAPPRDKSTFLPWNGDPGTISTLREIAGKKEYWIKLEGYLSEENGANTVSFDNIACIKSICKCCKIAENL
jgi:hypothetical protein